MFTGENGGFLHIVVLLKDQQQKVQLKLGMPLETSLIMEARCLVNIPSSLLQKKTRWNPTMSHD